MQQVNKENKKKIKSMIVIYIFKNNSKLKLNLKLQIESNIDWINKSIELKLNQI